MTSLRCFSTLKELAIKHIVTDNVTRSKLEKVIKEGEEKLPSELKQELVELWVNPIMLAVVQGDLNRTETLIKAKSPVLLSLKGEAVDYSRRTIKNITPFQAALCAWDDEMCEMLRRYMSHEEVIRQYHEIFPEGPEKYFKAQTAFDLSELIDVIKKSSTADVLAALNLQQNESLLCQKLNQFRADFSLRSQQEMVFNPKHLIKAFELFDNYYVKWRNVHRKELLWRLVVGYMQRFLPANIAQDTAQGLYYRQDQKSNRSFALYEVGSIFPLTFASFSGLGFHFCVCGSGYPLSLESTMRRHSTNFLSNLFDQKALELQKLNGYSKLDPTYTTFIRLGCLGSRLNAIV